MMNEGSFRGRRRDGAVSPGGAYYPGIGFCFAQIAGEAGVIVGFC